MLDPKLLEILVCPQCKQPVIEESDAGQLICEQCRLRFPVRDEIPVMLVDEAESF